MEFNTISTDTMADISHSLENPIHNNSHQDNPLYQTLTVTPLGNVDLESGDYKDGSINDVMYLLKDKDTNDFGLVIPDKASTIPINSSVYLVKQNDKPIKLNQTYKVIHKLKDINRVINIVNQYELPLFKVISNQLLLHNDQVIDIYNNSYEELANTGDEKKTKKFENIWNKYVGNESKTLELKPTETRNKNIHKIIKYFNIAEMIREYQKYF